MNRREGGVQKLGGMEDPCFTVPGNKGKSGLCYFPSNNDVNCKIDLYHYNFAYLIFSQDIIKSCIYDMISKYLLNE